MIIFFKFFLGRCKEGTTERGNKWNDTTSAQFKTWLKHWPILENKKNRAKQTEREMIFKKNCHSFVKAKHHPNDKQYHCEQNLQMYLIMLHNDMTNAYKKGKIKKIFMHTLKKNSFRNSWQSRTFL